MEERKYALVSVLIIWTLSMGLGLYGYGIDGLRAGLDSADYVGHPIDYALHWILLLGPPLWGFLYRVIWLRRGR